MRTNWGLDKHWAVLVSVKVSGAKLAIPDKLQSIGEIPICLHVGDEDPNAIASMDIAIERRGSRSDWCLRLLLKWAIFNVKGRAKFGLFRLATTICDQGKCKLWIRILLPPDVALTIRLLLIRTWSSGFNIGAWIAPYNEMNLDTRQPLCWLYVDSIRN